MTELIKSVKALGEAITGEKIEGDTLFDAVKDAGEKMTGKELKGKELNDIIAETADAYEGGDGGSSIIEVPANSRLTLDGNKLLQLLIAKGVDVDAEIEGYYSYGCFAGLLLGGTIEGRSYLYENVSTHTIFPCVDYNYTEKSNTYGIKWMVCENNGTYTTKPIEHIEHITFKTMLQALGTVDRDVDEIKLVPYVALKTSSMADTRPVDITTDEFLSFLTIVPMN